MVCERVERDDGEDGEDGEDGWWRVREREVTKERG